MNLFLRRRSALYLAAFAALLPLTACSAANPETIESSTSAICADPPCGQELPTKKPIPETDYYVDIPSSYMDSLVPLGLAGSRLSIDTTNSSPTVFGPVETITNPEFRRCSDAYNACTRLPLSQRAECKSEVDESCAGIPRTIRTSLSVHNYFTWGAYAKDHGASDVFFPLETLHHDGAVFSFDIDLHYIHVDFDITHVHAGFSTGLSGTAAAAWISVKNVQSLTPTVQISAGYIPNFDLTNMEATAYLTGLGPSSDGQSINYSGVESTFGFDWNAEYFPDSVLEDVYDVAGLIRGRVTNRINHSLDKDSAHIAISKIFTDMFHSQIEIAHKKTAKTITRVGLYSDILRVHYTPN